MGILLPKIDLSDILAKVKQQTKGNWIAWIHREYKDFHIRYDKWPDSEIADKLEIARTNIVVDTNCCDGCVGLSSCHFPEHNMPTNPVKDGTKLSVGLLHPHCHCKKKGMPTPVKDKNVWAHCSIEKFTKNTLEKDNKNGKWKLFYGHGYTSKDAELIQSEYIQKALPKYMAGDYKLGKLDIYGQRINITIDLNDWMVITAWVIDPNGHIRCASPLADDYYD